MNEHKLLVLSKEKLKIIPLKNKDYFNINKKKLIQNNSLNII